MDKEPVAQTHFVEYGRPFALPGGTSPQGTSPETCPPVWIGVVGNHGIYPVHVDDGTPRDRDPTGAEQGQSEPDDIYIHQFKPVAGAAPEDPVENAGTLFYPSFPRDWLLLFLGLSATCLGLAGVAFVQAAWSRRLRSSTEGLDLSKWPPFLRRVAVFLNWAPAEGWTKQGRFTGPGGFLLWALLYMSGVYFLTALPLFRIVPIAFIAMDLGGWAFWMIGLAALVLLALGLGTIAAVAVWWRDRGRDASPRDGQPLRQAAPRTSRWRRAAAWLVRHGGAAFAAFLIVGAVAVALAGGVRGGNRPPKGDLTTDRIDALLALYRANALPSGVSPVFPLLFLGLAWLGWVFSRLYSRYVQEQATPPGPNLDGASRPSVLLDEAAWLEALRWSSGDGQPEQVILLDEAAWLEAFQNRSEFERAMASPWRELLGRRPIVLALVLAFDAFILAGPLFRPRELRSVDGVWFVWGLTALFTLVFVCLTFHGLQLVLLWRRMRTLLRGIARLPLVGAMDRLPPRAARWVYEVPEPGSGRFEMVWRQARALAARSTDSVRQELVEARIPMEPGVWSDLKDRLTALDPSMKNDPLRKLREILLLYWRGQPVTSTFAGSSGAATGKSGDEEEGEGEGLRGIALALSNHEGPKPKEELPGWIKAAEDLIALVSLRWLAASLAQVWLMIGYLVAGTLCALLAVSSYPFPWQGRLLSGMGALVLLMVLTITVIVFGVNRDEVISRVANTTPHRIKLDQPLMASLFTYIVPLLGALAVLSFDLSDILRTWLDPILR